ncbi:DUF1800 domain-containing protein [Luteimonas aquatica]|uniref:DUF1800 domain-containing protein n=1 Tax=Luteimonas aquatica TaxID=450364 RepID=UPI001F5AC5B8|nr:DUF1800 domain-containing protein [Luteimonas aquatica]
MSAREAATAANRFGLGARPGELSAASDARGWLRAQLRMQPDTAAFRDLPDSLALLRREAAYQQQRKAEKNGVPERGMPEGNASEGRMPPAPSGAAMASAAPARGGPSPQRRELTQLGLADIAARYRMAATTAQPFLERLVRFWSNHFAVSIDKSTARLYAAPMEREAIRPHVLGRFEDMLLAVETHPAMLRYLDNVASVGDGSRLVQWQAQRARRGEDVAARKLGLNENLAREIMELHTLGVNGGYGQGDVTEFARAITGWSVPAPRQLAAAQSAFVFRQNAHEPGARRIMGKTYAEDGQAQGRAVLRDLALHPATARHLAAKLARHFVSDAPPEPLIRGMAKAYLDSGGRLDALYAALVDADAAWAPAARKFKTPDDFVVSAMRAGGFTLDQRPGSLPNLLRELGQPVFTPRSPAGFPDGTGDWAAGDALRKRLQIAATLANRVGGERTPLQLARETLGEAAVGAGAGAGLAAALQRAGSPREGYALLFASPAFQWRT